MYAVFVVVDGADQTIGIDQISETVIPRAKQLGARSGIWFYRGEGVGSSIVTFDDEATARNLSNALVAGQPVIPNVDDSPVVRSVEVCPVVASF